MQIYIHIGYPKNASTALQTDIFPNIDGAYYLGRHYINKSGYETQELSEALCDVTMQDSIEYSEEQTKKKVEFTLNSISESFGYML